MAEHDSGARLVWFLAGAALGAAGAILMAPQPGSETRDRLRRRVEEGRERVSEASRHAADRGREIYGRSREVADEAVRSGRDIVGRGKELYERGRQLADETAGILRGEGGDAPDAGAAGNDEPSEAAPRQEPAV